MLLLVNNKIHIEVSVETHDRAVHVGILCISFDDYLDVLRVKFHHVADSLGLLAGYQVRSGATEEVYHIVSFSCEVFEDSLVYLDWFLSIVTHSD